MDINLIFQNLFSDLFLSNRQNYFSLLDAITILFFAIVVAVIFKKLKLSPVIGYIFAGAIIGPYSLNLAGYNDVTKSLAEFGVVFLLFSVGLELTFNRLISMRYKIFGVGLLQFFVTATIFTFLCNLFFKNISTSFVVGTAFALSSTAIVLKLLSETRQEYSKTGKLSLSVLLFQDFAVVPLLVLIPLLNIDNVDFTQTVSTIFIKSIFALVIIIIIGRFLLRPAFHLISFSYSRNNDLFIATTLLVILGASFITSQMGLSLALGAFLAGVMIAETEFQTKVHSTIEPFKNLFLGFFFITEIGMHFDLSIIASNFPTIILGTFLLIFLKTIILFGIAIATKNKLPISLNTALLLSQAGEFSLILFEIAQRHSFINNYEFQNLSVIAGLSMAITPILAYLGKRLEQKFSLKNKKKKYVMSIKYDQIIIIGFNRIAYNISQILNEKNIDYVAIDKDPSVVQRFRRKSLPVYVGDACQEEFLIDQLQLEKVSTIILTMKDYNTVKKIAILIKKINPQILIITRVNNKQEYNALKKINTGIIISEIEEMAFFMSKELLISLGEKPRNINNVIEKQRNLHFAKMNHSIVFDEE